MAWNYCSAKQAECWQHGTCRGHCERHTEHEVELDDEGGAYLPYQGYRALCLVCGHTDSWFGHVDQIEEARREYAPASA